MRKIIYIFLLFLIPILTLGQVKNVVVCNDKYEQKDIFKGGKLTWMYVTNESQNDYNFIWELKNIETQEKHGWQISRGYYDAEVLWNDENLIPLIKQKFNSSLDKYSGTHWQINIYQFTGLFENASIDNMKLAGSSREFMIK